MEVKYIDKVEHIWPISLSDLTINFQNLIVEKLKKNPKFFFLLIRVPNFFLCDIKLENQFIYQLQNQYEYTLYMYI